MAEITAAMVKELREQTGAGMMDCKKALNETNGNMEEAVEVLRKNGQAKAVKKEGRIAAEGICRIAVKGDQQAAVVEVNSETDFVAKNTVFQEFVETVAKQAVESAAENIDAFLEEPWMEDGSKTVKDALVEKIAVIGEKLSIRRFEKVTASHGCVSTYVHGGGRIGVIVEADTDVVNDAVKDGRKAGEGDRRRRDGTSQQGVKGSMPVGAGVCEGGGRQAVRSSVSGPGGKGERRAAFHRQLCPVRDGRGPGEEAGGFRRGGCGADQRLTGTQICGAGSGIPQGKPPGNAI